MPPELTSETDLASQILVIVGQKADARLPSFTSEELFNQATRKQLLDCAQTLGLRGVSKLVKEDLAVRVKVAFGTDEHTPLTDVVRADVVARGHTVVAAPDGQWVEVGHAVGALVADERCDTGVLFCWTGTGASIAANKVPGVRAALCTDAATAAGAREWNDANVLVMSLRLTTPELAREMLDAWFATPVDPDEVEVINGLE